MDVHPTKHVSIGIDPYPYNYNFLIDPLWEMINHGTYQTRDIIGPQEATQNCESSTLLNQNHNPLYFTIFSF